MFLLLGTFAACDIGRPTFTGLMGGVELPPYEGPGQKNGVLTATATPALRSKLDVVAVGSDTDASQTPNLRTLAQEMSPVWRPDGKALAFARYHGDQADIHIWTQERIVRVTSSERTYEWPAAWSPDGESLLFVRGQWGEHSEMPTDLYVLTLGNGSLRRLTSSGSVERGADWSADNKIVFSALDDVYGLDIFTIDASGGEPTQLTKHVNEDAQPRFSPDGSQIVFVHAGDGGLPPNEVWVMEVDGTQRRPLHRDAKFERILSPVWSPDGRWIAFSRDSEALIDQVYRLRPEAPERVHRLVSDNTQYVELDWQPVSE